CFFFQAEDGIRGFHVTGVQTCALPIFLSAETFTTFRPDRRGEALRALFHELERSKQRGVPTVLSLVAPTSFLDAALQSELLRGRSEERRVGKSVVLGCGGRTKDKQR